MDEFIVMPNHVRGIIILTIWHDGALLYKDPARTMLFLRSDIEERTRN